MELCVETLERWDASRNCNMQPVILIVRRLIYLN